MTSRKQRSERTNRKTETTTMGTKERPKRPGMGSRDVLTVQGQEDGYVYRVVNDSQQGRNVQRMIGFGYEVVQDDHIKFGDRTANTSVSGTSVHAQDVGQGMTGILMRIPQEWYDEYQREKREARQEKLKGIHDKAEAYKNGEFKVQ